jgi:hypothetical protein
MATKKAAISDARVGDRAAQMAISNIRQRIEGLEAELAALTSQVGQSSASSTAVTSALNSLQAQINTLKTLVNAINVAGAAVNFLADVDLTLGDVVYPSSNGFVNLVDPNDPFSVFAAVGVVTTTATTGNPVTVQRFGHLDVGGSFDIGRAVYANAGGGLTQTPAYGLVAIPVGVADGASSLYVLPAWPSLLTDEFDPGFDGYVPVTLQLLRQIIDENTNNEIVHAFDDVQLDHNTRLCVVDASGGDVIVFLPTGFIDGGGQTRHITVYRRDGSSGPGGAVVTIVTGSGELIAHSYELMLSDGQSRSFLAVGAEGWIET